MDMVHKPIQALGLTTPLPVKRSFPTVNLKEPSKEEEVVRAVASAIYASNSPVLLVDSLIAQFGAKHTVRNLAEKLNFATFCPFMGKSIIHEAKPYFYGVYNGEFSFPGIQKAVEEESDLVLHLGPVPTSMNTGGFTAIVDPKKLISVQETQVIFKGLFYENIYLESC
jgi:pyruvate decarboxylase